MSERWYLNGSNIIYELMDSDIIIVNLNNGHYYSASGSALPLWAGLLKGATTAELGAQLAEIYAAKPDPAHAIAAAFIQQLQDEAIISAEPYTPDLAADFPANRPAGTLEPAILEVFSDIEELLLLDPIHEVDERGWPNARFDG